MQPAAKHLTPASRRCAQVHSTRDAGEEVELLVNLQQLVGRAGAEAFLLCLAVVDVALVL